MSNKIAIENFSQLASIIEETHFYFIQQVQKQVNTALTLRNWLIGQYIVKYEQNGADRADYGKALITKLSKKLRQRNLKGFSEIALRLNRSFYLNYPAIQQTLSVSFQEAEKPNDRIQQTLSVKFQTATPVKAVHETDINILLNHLSFSHFIELLKADNPIARSFYELQTLKNNWTVRQLQRAMNSMLYERTGLSKEIKTTTELPQPVEKTDADSMFINPLILEFLGLEEKTSYSESDLNATCLLILRLESSHIPIPVK